MNIPAFTYNVPPFTITVSESRGCYVARGKGRRKIGIGATRELAVAQLVLRYSKVKVQA